TGKVEDVLLLLLLRRAHAEAKQWKWRVDRLEACNEACLGTCAAGRRHDMVEREPTIIRLSDDFVGAVHIAERAGRIGSAARDDVDSPALGTEILRCRLHLGLHVCAAGALVGGGTMKMVEQH